MYCCFSRQNLNSAKGLASFRPKHDLNIVPAPLALLGTAVRCHCTSVESLSAGCQVRVCGDTATGPDGDSARASMASHKGASQRGGEQSKKQPTNACLFSPALTLLAARLPVTACLCPWDPVEILICLDCSTGTRRQQKASGNCR